MTYQKRGPADGYDWEAPLTPDPNVSWLLALPASVAAQYSKLPTNIRTDLSADESHIIRGAE